MKKDKRGSDRFRLQMPTLIRLIGGKSVKFELHTLSDTGFSGSCAAPKSYAATVVLRLPIEGDAMARLIWKNDQTFAGEFLRPINAERLITKFYGV